MTEQNCAEVIDCAEELPRSLVPPPSPVPSSPAPLSFAATAAALALAACGGDSASAPPPVAPPVIVPTVQVTVVQASRFLGQATMGAAPGDIAKVQSMGFDGWLTDQFNTPRKTALWDWLAGAGYNAATNINTQNGYDASVWRQLIGGPDQLRQRVGMALLDYIVVGIDGIASNWRAFAAAGFLDVLMDNAFGNYRTLLDQVTTNAGMAYFLTYLGNKKANATTGSVPDENYARELMQLFSLGLYQLNPDGTQLLTAGKPTETYTQADVSGIARVWTGWNLDSADGTTPDRYRRPLVNIAADHESGAKTFLGTTIAANTSGVDSKKIALDTIFAHPNIAPFVARQLIQRLVTSNPSPAYVGRVAAVFANNGNAVRGDVRAVVRAVLLDTEARDAAAAAASTSFGKLREPFARLTGWARAYSATSPSDAWAIGDTSSSATRLAQSPGRSQSVFGWFRPGYVPPNSGISAAGLVAPELQLTSEPTVIAYINYMQGLIVNGAGDFKPDYTALVAKAADSQALIDDINLNLAAGQLSAATVASIKTAVDSIAGAAPAGLANRVYTAILLTLASPDYLVQK